MSKAYTVTIDLPEDDAAFVDALLADGAYDTFSDLAATAIKALRNEDTADDLTPAQYDAVRRTYKSLRADPSAGISAAEVRNQLAAYHRERSHRGS